MSEQYHIPVMLQECIDGLRIKPEGIYVDVTFGGGGHSREILKYLNTGRLFAFDQDNDASREAKKINKSSFKFFDANFRFLNRFMRTEKIDQVDGILADLGISSHQIDTPDRGFSIRYEAELDMRMNTSSGLSAREVVNQYSERDLSNLLKLYGEIKNSSRVAGEIIRARTRSPIKTTKELVDIVSVFARRGKENTFLAKVFQALRLEVNDEMNALADFLSQCEQLLKPGGRLVIMSYHSLEDRMVKNLIKTGNIEGELKKDLYGNIQNPFKIITRKPMVASEKEVELNKRARSAKLRIAEKK